jgi:hypothetical protein
MKSLLVGLAVLASVLIHSENAYSQQFTQRINNAIKWYESNPKMLNTLCGGLRQHNRMNNASVFEPLYTQINSQIQKWTLEETYTFHAYITSNYCKDVW